MAGHLILDGRVALQEPVAVVGTGSEVGVVAIDIARLVALPCVDQGWAEGSKEEREEHAERTVQEGIEERLIWPKNC